MRTSNLAIDEADDIEFLQGLDKGPEVVPVAPPQGKRRLGRGYSIAYLVTYVKEHSTGEWVDTPSDIMSLRRIIIRGISELNLHVRKTDYDHVVESTITLIVSPSDEYL